MRRLAVLSLVLAAACGDSSGGPTGTQLNCASGASAAVASLAGAPTLPSLTRAGSAATMAVLGRGTITQRYTAEVWVRGDVAYTTTWGSRAGNLGNALYVWNVAGTPQLVDSVLIPDARTLGDVQASDDGRFLMVATEPAPTGSIVILSLANPQKPCVVTRFRSADTQNGVHTATIASVAGTPYGFLAIDPGTGAPAQLVIVDLSNPAQPRQVLVKVMGRPFVHDVYVRDGLLFTALWSDGVTIWDIGGGGRGGSVSNPVQIGNVRTMPWSPAVTSSAVHNIWWYHDAQTGAKRYAFVGEESSPSAIGTLASGDIHVVDISDLANPREVAFYHVDGAGTHNFSVDEARGVLYAAYYNGGVRAIDVRGDLGGCTAAQKSADGRCDLVKMGRELAVGLGDQGPVYVWGVHYAGSAVYASDMLNGLWKLQAVTP